ncbi:hypothetical protein ACEPAH_1161 [Sanghuangporus vaninii]
MFKQLTTLLLLTTAAQAHRDDGNQQILSVNDKFMSEQWSKKYGNQTDHAFSGPLWFERVTYERCLDDTELKTPFDIAILGMPFDTGVSYRPGARFGPFAIRSGSRRMSEAWGYTLSWGVNPYSLGSKVVDCGDVPVSPYDNTLAVDQMEVAYSTLLSRPVMNETSFGSNITRGLALDGKAHPRIVSLGGDHTVVLPILRSLHKVYGRVSVIHFDAHLDTWAGLTDPASRSRINHGTFFYIASKEGLMSSRCIHAGIRCKMGGPADLKNDDSVGFQVISADDIDDLGIPEIIKRIRARVGDTPVYMSLDIDVLDPAIAPATGTPEAGGWTAREVKRIIRGLAGLNFVGADVVEVSPSYDNAEITGILAADIVHDFLAMMLTDAPPRRIKGRSDPFPAVGSDLSLFVISYLPTSGCEIILVGPQVLLNTWSRISRENEETRLFLCIFSRSVPVQTSAAAHAHHHYDQDEYILSINNNDDYKTEHWAKKYGKQIDQTFSGPLSFSHVTYERCLDDIAAKTPFDIAILGMPFDTGVTYRSGARFGPFAIRSGARRQRETRGYTMSWGADPYSLGSKVVDCGDVPVSPFDNALAVDQMEVAYSTLLARPVANATAFGSNGTQALALDGKAHPRIISLGGDHTIVLPILRALHKVYGPISVIHFDAHLDTWAAYPGQATEQSRVTHGTFFFLAAEEGLMSSRCIHAGIRCKMNGPADLQNDDTVGFQVISTDDIDDLGIPDIIKRIRARVGDTPVYLSLDIDVLDPGIAPATGTPEAGGWTSREVKRILRGLAGLNFVGADVVEVAPSYDHAEITGIAAADIVHDFLTMMLTDAPPGGAASLPVQGVDPQSSSVKDEL